MKIMHIYTLTLTGDNFHPKNIKSFSELDINTYCEPRDFKTESEMYKYGHLCINGNSIIELAIIAKKILVSFSKDIESVEFDVTYFYDNQCNLEFNQNEIQAISNIGGILNVTCEKNSQQGAASEKRLAIARIFPLSKALYFKRLKKCLKVRGCT